MAHATALEMFRASQSFPVTGWTMVHAVDTDIRKYAVYMRDDDMMIGFYQTKGDLWPPSEDWITDGKFWKHSAKSGNQTIRVEEGFYSEYVMDKEDLYIQIETHKPHRVFIGAFSQGATHGTLLFQDLLREKAYLEVHAVCAGSPRVMSHKSARLFDRLLEGRTDCTFLRVWLRGDPVRHLPPSILDYRHVGQPVPLRFHGTPWWVIYDPTVHNSLKYEHTLGESGL